MGATACTCIYRPTSLAEHDGGATAVITVSVLDPTCPATTLHAKQDAPGEPRASLDGRL